MAKVKTAARKSAHPHFTAALLEAIADSGLTLYALAAEAGIDQSMLRRFVSRERSLTLPSADALAAVLGLQVIRRAGRRGRTAKSQDGAAGAS